MDNRSRLGVTALLALLWSAVAAHAQNITSFAPTRGVVGSIVTINGTGFGNAGNVTGVTFGGVAATFTYLDPTRITATVPSKAPPGDATGRIVVTTMTAVILSPTAFVVASATAGGIASFAPNTGTAGTVVTLNASSGTNLSGATSVAFSGIPASSFTVISSSQLTTVVPPGITTGLISVTVPGPVTFTSSTYFTPVQETNAVFGGFGNTLYTGTPTAYFATPTPLPISPSSFDQCWVSGSIRGAVCAPVANFFGSIASNWRGTGACVPNGAFETCPNDGVTFLAEGTFGQSFASTVPYATANLTSGQYETFAENAVTQVAQIVDYTQSPSPDTAAFRYKDLLYAVDSTQGGDGTKVVNQIEARLKSMESFYGPAERLAVVTAENILRDALKYAPTDVRLRNAMLDLYYDRAVAEIWLAKEKLAELAQMRLQPPAPGGFVIDKEIAKLESILGTTSTPGGYRFASASFFKLLTDSLGVDASGVNSGTASSVPFGYVLFQEEERYRSQYTATFLTGGRRAPVVSSASGSTPSAPGAPGAAPPQLFAGYKDMVLLFNLFNDYSQVVTELARRYTMRGAAGDRDRALDLLDEAHRKLYLEGNILLGVAGFAPPVAGDTTGLAEAVAGWRSGLTRLAETKDFINGNTNLLGFAPDFLVLVQSFQNGTTTTFDSYDSLSQYMLDATKGAPLTTAINRFSQAQNSYANYRGNNDQLSQQFNGSRNAYNERLRQITGVNRGDIPGYATPETNVGSEINQQLLSIDVARTRIEGNQVRLASLHKQIQIEVERRAAEKGVQNGMSQIMVSYGDKQAKLTEEISHVAAQQAAANAAASAISSLRTDALGAVAGIWAAVAQTVNGGIQVDAELRKGRLQAQKEKLAAKERAELNDLSGQILDINSAAQIKTILLQADTIAIDSLEAQIVLQQEVGRLASLYNEKADIESKMDADNVNLVNRYFADPVHRLRSQADLIAADNGFQDAQKWLFFLGRAFEYKWNQPFQHTYNGRSWSLASLFKLRNAQELQDMYNALAEKNGLLENSLSKDDHYDWFSFREDFFGYKRVNSANTTLYYADPVTGQKVDALTAFRSKLGASYDTVYRFGEVYHRWIVLDFSTVREIPGGSFFLGPRFDAAGNVVTKGLWLDKIKYLKVKIPGSHTATTRSYVAGSLTYSGQSFVRNQNVGTVDPNNPAHVLNEMTAWSTRYWYYDGLRNKWLYQVNCPTPTNCGEGLTDSGVQMELSADNEIPPTVAQIDTFKERSVAASGWKIRIPIVDSGAELIKVSEINDIKLYFYHYGVVRP